MMANCASCANVWFTADAKGKCPKCGKAWPFEEPVPQVPEVPASVLQPLAQVAPLPPMGTSTFQLPTAPITAPHGTPPGVVPEEDINRFNWGAFLLAPFWPFWNGAMAYGIAYWVAGIFNIATGGLSSIVCFALALYLGFHGNSIAVQGKHYHSREDFFAVQRAWKKGGLFLLLAWVGLMIVILLFVVGNIVTARTPSEPSETQETPMERNAGSDSGDYNPPP